MLVLALLLAFVSPSRKRKGEELPSEKLRRLSSPRHWDVASVPFPEDFVPLPTPTETGLACPAPWAFPTWPTCARIQSKQIPSVGHGGSRRHEPGILEAASLARRS